MATDGYSAFETFTPTVICDSHRIFTTVTSSPAVVRTWLFHMRRYHFYRIRKGRLLVGVGVQWKPSSQPGTQNPPATLQLCIGHRCLIFRLSHAATVPTKLKRFLSDPDITFVGINNKIDARLLGNHTKYGLNVQLIDMVDVVREVRCGVGEPMSMERLADCALGMTVRKDPAVGRSDWAKFNLSKDQVKYASHDAFVSFLLGKHFMAWRWNNNNNGDGRSGDSDGSY